ncbi:MAG: hypothetical protein IJP23_01915 [Oscillospiraceae bacterium]|nr:hypothetical protein [Oscillospiraceae bacterium]
MKEKAVCVLMVLVLALGLCGCADRGSVSKSDDGTITENNQGIFDTDDNNGAMNGTANDAMNSNGNGNGIMNGTANGTANGSAAGYNQRTGFSRETYNLGNDGVNRVRVERGVTTDQFNPNTPLVNVNDDYTLTGYGTADRINRDMAQRDTDRIDRRAYDISRNTNAAAYHYGDRDDLPRL